MHAALRDALNATEAAVASELTHVGTVLDAQIAKIQERLLAAEQASSREVAVQAAWDTFALLRTRHGFGVPTAPQPLQACAAPLHAGVAELLSVQKQ